MSATGAFIYTFNERNIIPAERFDWDDYRARLFRYALAEAFYNNTVYRDIERFSITLKHQYKLYKHIRGIYNPVYRQNELIKSKIAGGAIDWENLEKGALQIVQADPTLRAAIIQALKWSNWGVNKGLYAHQGALLGDVALKVVDDRARQKVRMEVLHPAKIKEADCDDVGNVKRVVIEYTREYADQPGAEPKDVVYTEVIDQTEFVTLKDGQEFPWYKDMNGKPISRWPNEYGFVPLVLAKFKDVGRKWGANAFHAETSKIHEINDAASILNDAIRIQQKTPMLLAGVKAPTSTPKMPGSLADGTATSDATAQRDQQNYIYADKEASAHSLIVPIDLSAAAANGENMLKELERDMPELALHRLRESGGDKPGIAIRNMYSDATGRLTEAAANMDDPFIRAVQMCVSIGGYRGYKDMEAFTLDSYDAGQLDFYVAERAFFDDGFSKQDKVSNLKSLPDKPEAARAVLEEMEYPPDKVDKIVAEIAMNAQLNMMQKMGGQQPPNGGPVNVTNNPRPQLPANNPQPQGDDAAVQAEVQRIMQEVMGAAA